MSENGITHYCLGNGAPKCDGCKQEKNWQTGKMMNDKTLCPLCGKGHLTPRTEEMMTEYAGQQGEVTLHFAECDACGSEITGDADSRANKRAVLAFRKSVDGLLTGAEVRALRDKYSITQDQAARLSRQKASELLRLNLRVGNAEPVLPTCRAIVLRAIPANCPTGSPLMPVLEGYANADTPHAKTVMAPGWTYGCHSSKVGDRPRGGPAKYRVQVGQALVLDCESMEATAIQVSRLHTTHWLDTNPDGTPLKCGHEANARIKDAQCIGCANRE